MVPLPPAVVRLPLIFTVPVLVELPMIPPARSTMLRFAIPSGSLVERIPAIVELLDTVKVLPAVSNVPASIVKSLLTFISVELSIGCTVPEDLLIVRL